MCVCYPIVLYRICCSVSCNSVCKCLLVFRFKLPHSPYMSAFEWHFTIHYFTLHRIVVRIFCFIFFSLFHLHLQTFSLSLSRLPFVCILFAFFFVSCSPEKETNVFPKFKLCPNFVYAHASNMNAMGMTFHECVYIYVKERENRRQNEFALIHWCVCVFVNVWVCFTNEFRSCLLNVSLIFSPWMMYSTMSHNVSKPNRLCSLPVYLSLLYNVNVCIERRFVTTRELYTRPRRFETPFARLRHRPMYIPF